MIQQLMDRLTASDTGYNHIQHAWTLDMLDQLDEPMPIALFVPGPIRSEPSESLPLRQRVTENVAVMTICAWQDLDTLRSQLYGALIGYQHAPEYTELEHVSGEVNRINGTVVQWMDMFSCQRWIGPDYIPPAEPSPIIHVLIDGQGAALKT